MHRQTAGDLAGARGLYERALEMMTAAVGEESAEVADARNNLGTIAYLQGDLEAARRYFERSIELSRTTRIADHRNVAIAFTNLARVAEREGDIGEAENLLREAMNVWGRNVGVESLRYAVCQSNLADLLAKHDREERGRDAVPRRDRYDSRRSPR